MLKSKERKWAIDFYNNFVPYFRKTGLSWKQHGNDYWTESIMLKVVGKMATEVYKLTPYSRFHYPNNEYMVDMCWERGSDKAYFYLDTAIEEEWDDSNYGDFMKDFYKLIDIKAYLKVFIFSPYKRKLKEWMEEFKKRIREHEIKLVEEVYLILSLTEADNDKTEVKGYIIDKHGRSECLDSKDC